MGFFAVEMKGKKGKCSCGMLAPKAGKAKNKLCAKGKGKASSVYKVQGKPKGKVSGLPKKYVGDAATYVGCYAIGAVESLPSLGSQVGELGVVVGGANQGGPIGGPLYGGCVGTCSTSGATHFSLTYPASGGLQKCTCLGGAPTAKKKGMKECARSCVGVPGKETCGDVGRAVVYALAGAAPAPDGPGIASVPPLPYPTPAPLPSGDVGPAGEYLDGGFDATYLGCFPDPISDETGAPITDRLMPVMVGKYAQDGLLTPELCKTACQNSGIDFGPGVVYDMFGLQNGKECWCGSSDAVSLPAAVPGGVAPCAKPCGGAPELTCGGNDHLVVYVTDDEDDIGPLDLLQGPAPVNTTYVGCFQNLKFAPSFSFLSKSGVMSASVCGATCKDAKPASEVFAVVWGKECWCDFAEGVTGEDLVKVPTDYCRTGPDAESCGGFFGGKTYQGLGCGGYFLADVYTFGDDVIPDLPITIPPEPAAPDAPITKALPPPPLP